MDEWDIERLGDDHERGEFCCGQTPLDDFIRTHAGQYERRGIGRTYVAVPRTRTRKAGVRVPVAGYYTLALGSVQVADLPAAVARKLPKHPVPTVLLARLAVDESARGKGLGAHLLLDAIHRAVAISDQAGAYAIEVVAIDDSATGFYRKYGFTALLDQDRHLFLPMTTAKKGI